MFRRLSFLLLAAGGTGHVLAQGPGDLGATPTRLVFGDRDRAAQVTLINRSTDSATYRVGFLHLRMDETGQYQEVASTESERFADEFLRFSPRQVTLAPGATQTIRLLVRKPVDLPAGEYRTHLLLSAVPPDLGHGVETEPGAADGVGVRLRANFRLALPVLVRHGLLTASAKLTDLSWAPSGAGAPARLAVSIERSGTRSLHGDLVATLDTNDGLPREIARVEGLSVWGDRRRIQLEIAPLEDLPPGKLRVSFVEKTGGDAHASAEAELALP